MLALVLCTIESAFAGPSTTRPLVLTPVPNELGYPVRGLYPVE